MGEAAEEGRPVLPRSLSPPPPAPLWTAGMRLRRALAGAWEERRGGGGVGGRGRRDRGCKRGLARAHALRPTPAAHLPGAARSARPSPRPRGASSPPRAGRLRTAAQEAIWGGM